MIVYRKRSSRFLDNRNYKDPFVQWLRQNSFTVKIRVQIPYGLYDNLVINIIKLKNIKTRGYGLIGKTAMLHIVNLGSTPNISIKIL